MTRWEIEALGAVLRTVRRTREVLVAVGARGGGMTRRKRVAPVSSVDLQEHRTMTKEYGQRSDPIT